MENQFLTFIKPFLTYIDEGHLFRKPFKWLYTLLAIINLLFPLTVLYTAIENEIFKSPGKILMVFLLMWILLAFGGWLGFQLWWDRKSKVSAFTTNSDEFIATPTLAHFIQTLGEWLGTYIGVVVTGVAIIFTVLVDQQGEWMLSLIDLPFLQTSFQAILTMPVVGFLVIVVARFISEQIRALAAIANNTKPKTVPQETSVVSGT